jgi:3-methyladenine DNA glycosylase/8-oxoguanine DNA glycosylase
MYRHYFDKKTAKAKASPSSSKSKKKQAKSSLKPKPVIVLPKPEQMEKIANIWEPYRSIACWYLWRSLDTKTIG